MVHNIAEQTDIWITEEYRGRLVFPFILQVIEKINYPTLSIWCVVNEKYQMRLAGHTNCIQRICLMRSNMSSCFSCTLQPL